MLSLVIQKMVIHPYKPDNSIFLYLNVSSSVGMACGRLTCASTSDASYQTQCIHRIHRHKIWNVTRLSLSLTKLLFLGSEYIYVGEATLIARFSEEQSRFSCTFRNARSW